MKQVFGAFVALAIGWGLCAPAHAQELFPLQAISGGGGGGSCSSLSPATTGPVPSGMTCDATLSDEFSGSSLDTSKWGTNANNVATDPCIIDPVSANLYVSGGALHQVVSVNTGASPSGCSSTSFNYPANIYALTGLPTNYYVEYRWRPLTANAALDPSAWSLGLSSTTNHAEVDDEELGSTNWFLWNNDYSQELGSQVPICTVPSAEFDGNFHVWGRSRISGVYKFYLDGTQFCTFTDPNSPNFTDSADIYIFQNMTEVDGGNGVPDASALPQDAELDYFRVYH